MEIKALNASEARAFIPGLAAVLVDCVMKGGSVNFMQPYGQAEGEAFFAGVAEGVAQGEIILLAAFDGARIVGTVQVHPAQKPNQPHRVDIAKMLVHSDARRKGVGEALLRAAEREAAAMGRTLGVLDTETNSAADRLYERCGWIRAGIIPDYALKPAGGLAAATFFYKRLSA